MKTIAVLCFVVIFQISQSSYLPYEGYKLYRINFDQDQAEQLRNIVFGLNEEFWLFSLANGVADVFVSPNLENDLLNALAKNCFTYNLTSDGIPGLIGAATDV